MLNLGVGGNTLWLKRHISPQGICTNSPQLSSNRHGSIQRILERPQRINSISESAALKKCWLLLVFQFVLLPDP